MSLLSHVFSQSSDVNDGQDEGTANGSRSWKNERKTEQERMDRKRKLDTVKEKVTTSSDGETTEDEIRCVNQYACSHCLLIMCICVMYFTRRICISQLLY